MVDTYDPKTVQISFGGTSIKAGISDGTFVSVVRSARARSVRVGSDSGVTIMVDPNNSATVQLTYLASSQTNTILDDFRKSEDATPPIFKVGMLKIEYLDGETAVVDKNAFIDGPPDIIYDTGETTRTWTIICPNVTMNARGTSPPERIGT